MKRDLIKKLSSRYKIPKLEKRRYREEISGDVKVIGEGDDTQSPLACLPQGLVTPFDIFRPPAALCLPPLLILAISLFFPSSFTVYERDWYLRLFLQFQRDKSTKYIFTAKYKNLNISIYFNRNRKQCHNTVKQTFIKFEMNNISVIN